MKIDFSFIQAVKSKCPVCNEGYVGGPPGQDEDTDMWVARHGKWHTDNPSVRMPPPGRNGIIQ